MSWKLSSRSQAFIVLVIISAIVMISEADKNNKENKYSKKANQPEKNNGDELYSDFR